MNQVLSDVLEIAPIFAYLYIAGLGHGLVEKSGILNLAVDGAFTLGVALAFTYCTYVLEPTAALALTTATIGVIGLAIAFLTTKLPISHGAVGLSLMFISYGLASYFGYPAALRIKKEGLELHTYVTNEVTSSIALMVSLLLGFLIYYILYKTKLGASIRAVGENPHAATTLGVDVLLIRLITSYLGYALIGVGSALYLLMDVKGWQEGSGMGLGWIAFAVSLAAGRHPLVTMFTSGVFSIILKYRYTFLNFLGPLGMSVFTLNAFQYATAVLAMIIFAVTPLRRRFAPPKSLGKIYFKEERTV